MRLYVQNFFAVTKFLFLSESKICTVCQWYNKLEIQRWQLEHSNLIADLLSLIRLLYHITLEFMCCLLENALFDQTYTLDKLNHIYLKNEAYTTICNNFQNCDIHLTQFIIWITYGKAFRYPSQHFTVFEVFLPTISSFFLGRMMASSKVFRKYMTAILTNSTSILQLLCERETKPALSEENGLTESTGQRMNA